MLYKEECIARITAVHRQRYAVCGEAGEGYARLKTKEYLINQQEIPTVGDYVRIRCSPEGESLIVETLPRKTCFVRRAAGAENEGQAVAANFDYVFILQSLNQDFNIRRLERYLALAWQSGAEIGIVLTKADAARDAGQYMEEARAAAMGVPVFAVSAVTGEGLAALRPYFRAGKTTVFLGSSGVGKSSLVNAVAGERLMMTGSIREDDGKGRHTTTHRQLITLKSGAMIIDTPGMRELGMWDAEEGIGSTFADIEEYAGECRFRDCRHDREPGCAVRAAVERGDISPERLNSYLRLKSETAFAGDKAGFLRRKQQRSKEISKFSKQLKKERRK